MSDWLPWTNETKKWFHQRNVCLPCMYGAHGKCRHYPEGERFSGPKSEEGRPCACEKRGHPVFDSCYIYSRSDWGSHRCARPAKGERPDDWGMGRIDDRVMVPACGIHIAAHKRVLANNAKRAEENRIRAEKWEAKRNNDKASRMWVERLAEEFGIESEPVVGSEKIRVSVGPEYLFGVLSEVRQMLDDVYHEHPLRKGE